MTEWKRFDVRKRHNPKRKPRIISEEEMDMIVTINVETREVTGDVTTQTVQSAIDILRAKLEEDFRESVRRLEEQARCLGINLTTYVGGNHGRRRAGETTTRRTPSQPRYCHPTNPLLTWSGMGRQPAWFAAALAEGYTEEDLLIVKPDRAAAETGGEETQPAKAKTRGAKTTEG